MVILPHYVLDPKRILMELLRGLLPARLRGTAEDDNRSER
jgi:hypothetical protein